MSYSEEALDEPNVWWHSNQTNRIILLIVVARAGHNSLIAAAYLAKAGYCCLVLEMFASQTGGSE